MLFPGRTFSSKGAALIAFYLRFTRFARMAELADSLNLTVVISENTGINWQITLRLENAYGQLKIMVSYERRPLTISEKSSLS